MQQEKTLEQIQGFPTVLNNTHESCYRTYHILRHVLTMIERGDSKETINEVVGILMAFPEPTGNK